MAAESTPNPPNISQHIELSNLPILPRPRANPPHRSGGEGDPRRSIRWLGSWGIGLRPANPRPMRPIRLPEPPGVGGMETPEIFTGAAAATVVVRRAVVIGNGSPGAENQCLGLVRALGLADHLTLYVSFPPLSLSPQCSCSCSTVDFFLSLRFLNELLCFFFFGLQRVTRPQGGINEWLHFLPVSLHKLIDQVLRQFFRNTRLAPVVEGRKHYRVPNGGSVGVGLSSVLEADAKKIVAVARDTFEK